MAVINAANKTSCTVIHKYVCLQLALVTSQGCRLFSRHMMTRTWKRLHRQTPSIHILQGNRKLHLNQQDAKPHTRQRALPQLNTQHQKFVSQRRVDYLDPNTIPSRSVACICTVTVPAGI